MIRRSWLVVAPWLVLLAFADVSALKAAPSSATVEFLVLVRTEHPMKPQDRADVTIRDKITHKVVATGRTDVLGEWVLHLKPGYYLVEAKKGRLTGAADLHLNPAPKARITIVVR
ncbi:MAG TPA: hypothetical protein PLN21_17205 [Gemmatales bacterium]|nr:hypothetical protein [Gemmatales bacterium]